MITAGIKSHKIYKLRWLATGTYQVGMARVIPRSVV